MKRRDWSSVGLVLGALFVICVINQIIDYVFWEQILDFVNRSLWRALVAAVGGLVLSFLISCIIAVIVKRIFFSHLYVTDSDMEKIEGEESCRKE